MAAKMELSLTQPDDWHLHLRDGDMLEGVVSHSASHFGRAIVMPNLKPPVTTAAAAMTYRESILKALPPNTNFTPLMTLYLTDNTHPDEIKNARKSGVVFAVKLYPAGATTNSQDGVTDRTGNCLPVLKEMVEQNMPLLVHGEVTDQKVDTFDHEKVFIDTVLRPLTQKLPELKIVMEHITTQDAVRFVESYKEGYVAATVTPQHLLLNRNSLFQGGLQPHNYCLPVLKRSSIAIVSAVTSGSKHYFLGTDSSPHKRTQKECSCGCAGMYNAPVALSLYAKVFEEAGALEKLEAFTSLNGPDFYGLTRNTSKIKMSKTPWKVPESYTFKFGEIVPMFADPYIANLILSEGESVYDYCWYPYMSASDPSTCVFATTTRDHPIHLWDATSGQLRCTYRAYDNMDEISAAFSVAFNPSGSKMFAGYNKSLRVFDLHRPGRDFDQFSTVKGNKEGQSGIISTIAFCPTHTGMFATGSYNQTTAMYREDNMELLYLLHGQEGGVTHVQFSKDGNYLYTGGRKDPYILCWDIRNTVSILYKLYRSTDTTNQRILFDIEPCGRHLATGGQDGQVHIYDLQNGQWVTSFQAASDTVNGFCFHPFLPMAASSSGHRRFGTPEGLEENFSLSGDDNSVSIWSFYYASMTENDANINRADTNGEGDGIQDA